MSEPIFSPDGNFIWDGAQWVPVQNIMAPKLSVQPNIQPKSSGMLNVNPHANTQTRWETLNRMGVNKGWGKTRIEISGINQTLDGLMQLFQGGTLTPISENMVLNNTTQNSLSFIKTGRMTTIHLDVFFHNNQSIGDSETISNFRLEMYVISKHGKKAKKYTYKIQDLEKVPVLTALPIKLAINEASKKLTKLETDLLEILASG